jgi:hypothetical protein
VGEAPVCMQRGAPKIRAAAHNTNNFHLGGQWVSNAHWTYTPSGNREPIRGGMERMDSAEAMKQFERMVERTRVEGVGPLPARLPVAHNF